MRRRDRNRRNEGKLGMKNELKMPAHCAVVSEDEMTYVEGGSYLDALSTAATVVGAVVLHSEKPVLLDFWASWCGPCRMLSPIVDEVAEERSDVKVGKVNVDEQPDLAAQFGVMSIPTLLVFQNGRLVNQAVGARPKSGVLALLDR